MSVFEHVVGQQHAIAQLQRAAEHPQELAQSWLVCGPAGSGRTQLARCFAAALECPDHGCGVCSVCQHVLRGTHPDVTVLSTDQVTLSIDQVREVISKSEQMPATAAWRIIIIEDFERMLERTTNVLLKEIEEPSAHAIWILCAPSAQDVLPTIRSRTRVIHCAIPTTEQISQYLQDAMHIDQEQSMNIARFAQGNLDLAQQYAQDNARLQARNSIISRALTMRKASEAVLLAENMITSAQKQAQADADTQMSQEQQAFLHANGLAEGDAIPAKLRSAYNALGKKDVAKRLATRRSRDVFDHMLIALASVYRDALVIAQGADQRVELVNSIFEDDVRALAQRIGAEGAVKRIEAIQTARARLAANGNTTLVFEALLCSLLP